MRKCPRCKANFPLGEPSCPHCRVDLVLEPARPPESGSLCSDWVAELEAARGMLQRLMNRANEEGNSDIGIPLSRALRSLSQIVDEERGRSATEVDRRAARKKNTRTAKWWVVECRLGIPDWQQCCGTYESQKAAQAGVEIAVKNVGEKHRDKLRIVAVVAVERTETVVTRKTCSPIEKLTHDAT